MASSIIKRYEIYFYNHYACEDQKEEIEAYNIVDCMKKFNSKKYKVNKVEDLNIYTYNTNENGMEMCKKYLNKMNNSKDINGKILYGKIAYNYIKY